MTGKYDEAVALFGPQATNGKKKRVGAILDTEFSALYPLASSPWALLRSRHPGGQGTGGQSTPLLPRLFRPVPGHAPRPGTGAGWRSCPLHELHAPHGHPSHCPRALLAQAHPPEAVRIRHRDGHHLGREEGHALARSRAPRGRGSRDEESRVAAECQGMAPIHRHTPPGGRHQDHRALGTHPVRAQAAVQRLLRLRRKTSEAFAWSGISASPSTETASTSTCVPGSRPTTHPAGPAAAPWR